MTDLDPAVQGSAISVTITSARLRLEPLGEHHAAPLFEGMRDPAIYEWISLAPSPTLAHLRARWARVAQLPLTGVDVLDLGWAVQRLSDGQWIGKMDAEVTTRGVATNVGYLLLPAFWRQGYATEAVVALCGHLRRHGVVEQHATVTVTVTVGNEASCRVLERAGFVREGVIVGNDEVRGVIVDDVSYVRRDRA